MREVRKRGQLVGENTTLFDGEILQGGESAHTPVHSIHGFQLETSQFGQRRKIPPIVIELCDVCTSAVARDVERLESGQTLEQANVDFGCGLACLRLWTQNESSQGAKEFVQAVDEWHVLVHVGKVQVEDARGFGESDVGPCSPLQIGERGQSFQLPSVAKLACPVSEMM